MKCRRSSLTVPLLLALLAPTAGQAAPVAPPANPSSRVTLMRPLTLTKLRDMDFGELGVTGAGTAVINAVTDTMTTTGGVVSVGGTPHAAIFRGVAQGNAVVIIRIPNGGINLTRVGGTETMIVDNFTISGDKKNVVAKELFTFSVGGTLHVNANQVDGVYVGTFDVEVQYN